MRIKQLLEFNAVGHGNKLTMPDNTIVIDTPGDLDWYKIGQHYPTLNKADPKEFGNEDSDMVISFITDQEKQAFLKLAKRLGLVTKDISGTDIHPEIHNADIDEGVNEASYAGNIGIMELIKFNQKAAEAEKNLLRRLIDAGLNKQAWQLVQKVTGVKLVGDEFNEDQLTEGWKEALTNLAISGAIGLGATAGLVGKQAIDDFMNPTAEKPAVVQQVDVKKPTATFNRTIPAKQQATQKAEPKKIEKPKSKEIKVAYTTESPNERILMRVAQEFGIKGIELAAFMAQMHHESEGFADMVEDHPNVKRYLKTKSLGNKDMNDAKRFIGRGFIQLTGRWNYKWMEKELGIDLTSTWSNAHKAANPEIAAKIAVKYWQLRVRPNVTNFKDVRAVTKKINPGLHGLESRKEKYKEYLQASNAVPTNRADV